MQALPRPYLELLKTLIRIPSFSGEEAETADVLEHFFKERKWNTFRKGNNIWTTGMRGSSDKPVVLLNAHHDTVRPNSAYSRDPFDPVQIDGKLYGLGSNDDGGPLVCLIAAFEHLMNAPLPFQLILLASAEEENSGPGGIELALKELPEPAFALVGEPTSLQFAAAEKGLMVLDIYTTGVAGHAARDSGRNAIYEALPVIDWMRSHPFTRRSDLLGPVHMTVTQISAGIRHNQIPEACHIVADVRSNELYTNEELLAGIREAMPEGVRVEARSTRLKPSGLPSEHLASRTARALGLTTFGSPTLSDQALLTCPSAKMGPGRSERSHTADEFILIDELAQGWNLYINFIRELAKNWES